MSAPTSEPHAPRRRIRLDLLLFAVIGLHAFFPVVYALELPRQGLTESDWLFLKRTADHFVAGDWRHLYALDENTYLPDMYWRYPPFVLYAVAPLALFPDYGAYLFLVTLGSVALGATLWLLRDLAPPGPDAGALLVAAVVLSAPMLTMLVAGQNSALLALCIVGAAALWTRGKVVAACVLLGLLAAKPNWGIFFGIYALARKEWRGAAAMVATVALLCLSSAPLGVGLWSDFLLISAANDTILHDYQPWKQATLRGFYEAILGVGGPSRLLWVGSALGLLVAAWTTWRRERSPLEHLSAVVLLLIAANPYVSFYDVLVLLIPAAAWWAGRDRWNPTHWKLVGAVLAAMWIWEHAIWTWPALVEGEHRLPFSLVGPGTALWLVLQARGSR